MNRRLPLAARIALAIGLFFLYTVLSTQIFLRWSGMLDWVCDGSPCFAFPYYQWWLYLFDLDDELVRKYLMLSGCLAALPIALPFISAVKRSSGGWSLRRRWPPFGATPSRAPVPHLENSRWPTPKELNNRWPSRHGMIVAELSDPRLDSRTNYRARDKRTWGRGGKGKLLVDPLLDHHLRLTIGGSGMGKTALAVPTLVHPQGWGGPIVVLDPKNQLAPMCTRARKRLGHDVVVLNTETAEEYGTNPLRAINIHSKQAETDLNAVVQAMCGATPANAGGNSKYFKDRGKTVVTCVLGDMLWNNKLSSSMKTLEYFILLMAVSAEEMRKTVLPRIAAVSDSRYAKLMARQVLDDPEDTFGGVFSSASQDTQWLLTEVNAKLVSGNSFDPRAITRGKTDVFISLSPKTLDSSPGLARLILWSLFNAFYEADGRVAATGLFLLDEAKRLGHMRSLEIMRDFGRSFGLGGWMFYQAETQIGEQFGRDAIGDWLSNAGIVDYLGVRDPAVAERLSRAIGDYPEVTWSENVPRGSSAGQSSRGSVSYSVRMQRLMPTSTILTLPRDALLITGGAGERATILHAPFYYRRRDCQGLVDLDRFMQLSDQEEELDEPAEIDPETGEILDEDETRANPNAWRPTHEPQALLLTVGGGGAAGMTHPKVEWMNMVAGAHMRVPFEQWIKDGFLHWLPIVGVRDEVVKQLHNIAG